MEHVVFFPAPDGTPAFRRVADFEEAVRFVEHLRNVDNVTGASVYTLTEVPLSFRAWYRVEVPAADGVAPAPLPETVEVSASAATFDELPVSSAPTPVIDEHTIPFVEFAPIEEPGSATGIVVPDQSGSASDPADPYEVVPIAAASLAPSPFDIDGTEFAVPVAESAPVFEPAAGARRDRGLGFFAR